MEDLFQAKDKDTHLPPLAVRMRPSQISEIIGQSSLISNKALTNFLDSSCPDTLKPGAILLYGPPGSGKTSIASLLSHNIDSIFISVSATEVSIKELRQIRDKAIEDRVYKKTPTYLFVDEIHRFSKTQIDFLLPILENKDLYFIAATTENPFNNFSKAFLSRLLPIKLEPLSESDLLSLLQKTCSTIVELNSENQIPEIFLKEIAKSSDGDARRALSTLELVLNHCIGQTFNQVLADSILQNPYFVNDTESHYDYISALIKSIRGSDPDAAIYWLTRSLQSSEDIFFITRRLSILAAEDVGLADPEALAFAVNTESALRIIGMPEGGLLLANLVIYLALTDKSNSTYAAYKAAGEAINVNVPNHIKTNTGKEYLYPHDNPSSYLPQRYLPNGFDPKFYLPKENGFEKELLKRYKFRKGINE